MYRFLLTDKTFKELNIPIPAAVRKEMSDRTRKNGRLEDIYVWNGYILTGYEQDDLCLKYHRSFTAKEMFFPRKSDAIAWVCNQQLKRVDLVWTARAWLISRLYEALRDIEKRKAAKDEFQYKKLSPSNFAASIPEQSRENVPLLKMLGEQFHYNKETIRRYVDFGRRLDRLEGAVPGIRERILTGNLEVTIKDMPALNRMTAEDLKRMAEDRQCNKLVPPREVRINIEAEQKTRRRSCIRLETGIKKMPVYDPDAELNGLTYTIMAWIRAVRRARESGNLRNATPQGKENLDRALRALVMNIDSLYKTLEEPEHE